MALCAYTKGAPVGEEPGDIEHPPCAACGGSPFAFQHLEDEPATGEVVAGDIAATTESH